MAMSINLKFPTSRGIFSSSDDKYVKLRELKKRPPPLEIYKFRYPKIYKKSPEFKRNALPIEFQVTPDTLLNLAARVVDALPLPRIYEWSNFECCKWIRQYGYPQYQNTFRENLITGRKLLLVDAQALSAMNIKHFEHIKHIAYGIRQLFHFEMTKFMRSISLPPEYYYELYKLLRTKTERNYESVRRSDLWRRMQLLRPKGKSNFHWDLLAHWLTRESDTIEITGGIHRYNLYGCKIKRERKAPKAEIKICNCPTLCNCYWVPDNLKQPDVLTVLKPYRKEEKRIIFACCKTCVPPCTCHWPSKYYKFNGILSCLKQTFPTKYITRERVKLEVLGSFYSHESRLYYT